MIDTIVSIFTKYNLVGAFLVVAVIMIISYTFASTIKQRRMGSAIAIVVGLALSFVAGKYNRRKQGAF